MRKSTTAKAHDNGYILKAWREKSGRMRVDELAEKMECGPQAIYDYESGKRYFTFEQAAIAAHLTRIELATLGGDRAVRVGKRYEQLAKKGG